MPLTIQKLQVRLAEMALAVEGAPVLLSPVFVAPASGPMTPPPMRSDPQWSPLEVVAQQFVCGGFLVNEKRSTMVAA